MVESSSQDMQVRMNLGVSILCIYAVGALCAYISRYVGGRKLSCGKTCYQATYGRFPCATHVR